MSYVYLLFLKLNKSALIGVLFFGLSYLVFYKVKNAKYNIYS